MQLRSFAIALTVFTATVAFAADGNFDRTLNVSGAPTLSVYNGAGYVHVYSGSGDKVHIVGHVHARPGLFTGDVDRTVKEIVDNPPIVQSGSTITIRSPHDSEIFRYVSIDYDITTPASTALAAHTGSGGIEIGGLQGSVEADTGSGGIHVDNIAGNTHLQTGSGSINATGVHGSATVQTGSGHITLAVTAPGEIRAHTGSGGMDLSGVSGPVRAETGSGGIQMQGNPTDEWRVHTGSGGVRLHVPSDARFNLDAETGSGGIHVDRPITMQASSGKHHISGSVNGGGPTLRVSTGSGGISVE